MRNSPTGRDSRSHKPRYNWKNGENERNHGTGIHAAPIAIAPDHSEDVLDGETLLSSRRVVADQYSAERAHQAGVADEPGEDISARACVELPGHHENPDNRGDDAAGYEADSLWAQVEKVICRRAEVGLHVRVQLRRQHDERRKDYQHRAAYHCHEHDRIPNRLAEYHDRRARHRHTDEREGSHRRRQTECLTRDLRALASGVPREIRDVETERGPVSDVRRERRRKELPERHVLSLALQPLRFDEDVTQASAVTNSP